MRRFQDILYVTDGLSDDTEILKQALGVAHHCAATLHVLIVGPELPSQVIAYKDVFEASMTDRARACLEHAKAELGGNFNEVPATVEVECGKQPAIRIVRRVLREQHDLVIKQVGDVQQAGFRSQERQLLRQCPCPLWLGRPITRPPNEIRVGVAIDPMHDTPEGHDLAIQLLKVGRFFADMYSGELWIISCWDFELEQYLRDQPWFRITEEELADSVSTTEREHRERLDALVRESGIQGTTRTRHERGNPERLIPELVESDGVDILVIGTIARTGIPGLVIGNTAENVLEALKCSVVALKPNGFVSSVKAY
jgi:nucleotide-binding universal stress UspA family protein